MTDDKRQEEDEEERERICTFPSFSALTVNMKGLESHLNIVLIGTIIFAGLFIAPDGLG